MPPGAVLFDVDGTLIDSNYLHVAAWYRAFLTVGEHVPQAAIHRSMGMGTPQLLTRLLGAEKAERLRERLIEMHSQEYAADRRTLLRVLPGARELVRSVHGTGARVVLCTSANGEELEDLLKVLDCQDYLDDVAGPEDVDTAKPAPDLVRLAVERAGVSAQRAVFVGDTVWDVQAAAAANVGCVGLLTGGIAAAELCEAGAAETYDDAAHLLRRLGDSALAPVLG